ncbi:cytochrome c [Inhella sp. 1Y17]|uniref:Cytochrome c n=2 Tax=Inhella proteolytica TaxID=2795029 RepID=A0A931J9T7_9BURK|nr:cytochrome c [Inhella proteolytica]
MSPSPSPQARENPDPQELPAPIPWFVVLLVALMLTFGLVYITLANVETPSHWGDDRTAAELQGSRPAGGAAINGAALYASLCVACHQANGAGVPGVFPPLAGSEWVRGRDAQLARIVLQGVSGTLTVKGVDYQGVMPAFKQQLGDAEMAALLTHLRSQWGNGAAPVSADTVATARKSLETRDAPLAGNTELSADAP